MFRFQVQNKFQYALIVKKTLKTNTREIGIIIIINYFD
jgi:hypothetical protein